MLPTFHLNPQLDYPAVAKPLDDIKSAITHPISALGETSQNQLLDYSKINLNSGFGFHSGDSTPKD